MGKKKTKKALRPLRVRIDIGVEIYLDALLEGRMMIQASSGGGKSYMSRVLAERLMPHVPVIILDWEGEFTSLREDHDMVLVGEYGEVPCVFAAARVTARSLIEAHLSAIIDLSGLKTETRKAYVRDFLTALVDELPKKHWPSTNGRDVVIIVDEAHKLCPQGDRCVSTSAVIDLQAQGRKRGICGILATQRLSKLHKDAAAECKTNLIGSCHLVDAKRGCEILGLPQTDKHMLTQTMTGWWRGIGAAFLQRDVKEFQGQLASTPHGRVGGVLRNVLPAQRRRLKKLMTKLQGIKLNTEQEIKDFEDAKKELAKLRRELTLAKKAQPGMDHTAVAKAVAEAVEEAASLASKKHESAIDMAAKQRDGTWKPLLAKANKEIERLLEHIKSMVHLGQKALPMTAITVQAPEDFKKIVQAANKKHPPMAKPMPAAMAAAPSSNGSVPGPNQKVLNSVAWWNQVGVAHPSKECVAIMARYSAKSGGYNNILGRLRTNGYIDYPTPGHIELTAAGADAAVTPTEHGTLEELHGAWREVLSAPQIKLMDAVIEVHPNGLEKEELAEATDYSPTSGGFNNLLGRLRKLGIITKGKIHATLLLFPEALV